METICVNKRANYDYFLFAKFEAGIVLAGSEVKSVRKGNISINESFVQITADDEIFLKNAYIKPEQTNFAPDSKRTRKLLLHKSQILKLNKEKEKGMTIIPTKVYLSNGLVKVEIALAKGKKLFDKRQTIKEKTIKREILKSVKNG